MNVKKNGPVRQLLIILEMIKFEHTIFALPFALASALVAAHGLPSWSKLGWIFAAMVGARSSAMTFNRITDWKLDSKNPRTATRAIPVGLISVGSAWLFTTIAAALLIFAAYMLNPLAFALSPVALMIVLGYSYSKRFTSLSHLWLGLSLGIAPVGAWIAVKGEMSFPAMVFSAAVVLWTAGFDIIYSFQDIDFDTKTGLFSLPARFGAVKALTVSRLLHACTVVMLAWFGILANSGAIYYIGVAFIAIFLIYEQSLISPKDFSKVNTAFFTMNGCVSLAIAVFVALDIFL